MNHSNITGSHIEDIKAVEFDRAAEQNYLQFHTIHEN